MPWINNFGEFDDWLLSEVFFHIHVFNNHLICTSRLKSARWWKCVKLGLDGQSGTSQPHTDLQYRPLWNFILNKNINFIFQLFCKACKRDYIDFELLNIYSIQLSMDYFNIFFTEQSKVMFCILQQTSFNTSITAIISRIAFIAFNMGLNQRKLVQDGIILMCIVAMDKDSERNGAI